MHGVSEVNVRPLADSEFRPALDLFVASLQHGQRPSEERWQRSSTRYEPGRVFGAFLDGELSGTAMSLPSTLVVPGGAVLPSAAVTGVGVRADRTRRGLLRGLMDAQLTDTKRRGEPLAMLHASETAIYPRFGYGMASRSQRVALRRADAVLRPDAPGDGNVRLLDGATAEKLLPETYARIGNARHGMMARSEGWWTTRLADTVDNGGGMFVAVHSGPDGDDGFVLYETEKTDHVFGNGSITAKVVDLHAADTAAEASLWRFLLGLDLVTDVIAPDRPMDEALSWWLADSRACQVTRVDDDLWVRLVDVPHALAERTYGAAEPVIIEVRDAVLPENAGNYRITSGDAVPCDEPAQITLDADALGSIYLGEVAPSTLAAANRIQVHDPAALAPADALFATARPPWCGTQF